MKHVLIVGAGAAGIMAALAAAEAGAKVTVFEKNDIVGKKMGITGKGRCNLTNPCPMSEFIARTGPISAGGAWRPWKNGAAVFFLYRKAPWKCANSSTAFYGTRA